MTEHAQAPLWIHSLHTPPALEWAYCSPSCFPDRAEEALNSRGEALYRTRCASCHEGGVARAPDTNALRQFRPERMSFALMFGMMSPQGRDLSQGEIQGIVHYLVGAAGAAAVSAGFQVR